jgi:hypothetical protein
LETDPALLSMFLRHAVPLLLLVVMNLLVLRAAGQSDCHGTLGRFHYDLTPLSDQVLTVRDVNGDWALYSYQVHATP